MINRSKVISIAKLANIKISDEKIDKFVPQISAVLAYFDILKKIDTSSVKNSTHLIRDTNRFCKSEVSENSLSVSEALSNANDTDGKYFKSEAVL